MARALDHPIHSFPRVSNKELSLSLSFTTFPTTIYSPFLSGDPSKTHTRGRLAGGSSGEIFTSRRTGSRDKSVLARVPGKSQNQQSQPSGLYFDNPLSPPFFEFPRRVRTYRTERRMPRKRRSLSLQAILIPSFLQSPVTSPTSPTFARSSARTSATPNGGDLNYFGVLGSPESGVIQTTPSITSPRASPPPSYLIDDDPFADLTCAPSEIQRPTQAPQTPPKPGDSGLQQQQSRSPLTPNLPIERIPATAPSSPALALAKSTPPPPPPNNNKTLPRTPVPAYQKPAFAPKPSLPSLNDLSKMNFVLKKKVRKGRVGAGLPFEPWDHPEAIPPAVTTRSRRPSTSPSPSSSSTSGFVSLPGAVDQSGVETSGPLAKLNLADEIPDLELRANTVEEREEQPPSIHQALADVTTGHSDNDNTTEEAGQLPHTTTADVEEETFDSSPSLPALSPGCSLNESFASLSRSTSTSSSGSDEYHFGRELTSGGRYGNGMGDDDDELGVTPPPAASEGDLLIRPFPREEEDYFSFPTAYTSADAISNWRDDTRFHDDEHYLDSLDQPDMFVNPQRRRPGVRTTATAAAAAAQYSIRPPHSVDEQNDGGFINAAAEFDPYRRHPNPNILLSPRPRPSGDSTFSDVNGAPFARRSATSSNGASSINGQNRPGTSDGRNSRRPSAFSPPTTSSSEPTSDEDSESADEGKSAAAIDDVSNSDDDVPLARRIPTALLAQKSIRKQVREERDQRRRERAENTTRTETRSRQTTLRPGVLTGSQEVALHTPVPSTKPIVTRPRTQTLPGRATPPFSPEDLTKKLQDVQVTSSLPRHRRVPSNARPADIDTHGLSKPDPSAIFSPQPISRPLHPSRSFYNPRGRSSGADNDRTPVPHMPGTSEQRVHRARSQSRPREDRPTFEDASLVPVPRMSDEQKRVAREPSVRSTTSRPSTDMERRLVRPSTADRAHHPPVPPLPATVPDAPALLGAPRQMTQQRVFVGDMQRYNIVEIDDTTTAGDVVKMLEAQGSLKGWIGNGDWMVWEVSQDFGMERPVRHFERISDVQASWNKDKMVNTFVARLTPLAPLLSRSAIPSSSPIHAGYIEWESKRGKWSKRWLQLREHSLWISKRDNGRDETLLCSLSNFDAYHFTRQYKSPKPFAFALKSTDKFSFFENASDYKHVISCSEKDGKVWMEKILLARSYVLHQERNVLFNPKSYGGQPTMGASSGISRAPTQRRPAQPLVSVANTSLFEPGSLLHRKL